jgi:hypothetical protein
MSCRLGSLPGPELFFLFALLFLLSLHRVRMTKTKSSASKKAAPKPARRPRPPKKVAPVKKKKAVLKPAKLPPATARNVAQRPPSAQRRPLASAPSGAVSLRQAAPRQGPNAGIGRMNRAGTQIERIQQHKNLVAEPPAERGVSRAERWLAKNMSPEDLMSPDARRYCALLDDPLNAPWGDVGEVSVRPLVYTETVPPSTTKTVRCFGQTEIQIPPNYHAWVMLAGGSANIVAGDDEDGDDLGYAWPNLFANAGVAGSYCATLGAPNDGRTLAGAGSGQGVAGYYYLSNAVGDAPSISTNETVAQRFLLSWGSPVPLGELTAADSSQYKYRPVAGGILITPDDVTFEVGGHYDAMIIPQATNTPYVASSALNPNLGTAPNEASILALPDHCIQRADDSISVNWLPGRMDYSFLATQTTAVATLVPATVADAPNARVWIKIEPPNTTNPHSYVLSYTGFFEVGGRCVQQVGSVPRPQPSLGAKVATSVQNNLNIELDDRSRQVTEGATLEVMKDHPKIGPMVEDCKSMPEAKSALDEIVEFGKDLLPLVGLFL